MGFQGRDATLMMWSGMRRGGEGGGMEEEEAPFIRSLALSSISCSFSLKCLLNPKASR